eukprot:6208663-Pleurochrysis_carterae.AAC.1
MDGTKKQTVLPLVYVWVALITWLTRVGKERAEPEQEEHKKNKGGEKASSRATRKIQQRRIIQQRIKRWNKTRGNVEQRRWRRILRKAGTAPKR